MNKNITRRARFGLALGLGCMAFVPQALACPGEGGGHGKGFKKADPQTMIQRFDKNGDGVLEVKELPELLQERLAAADTNKDGKLTVQELEAHRAAHMAERGKRHFAKLDKNGDGVLTKDEVGEKKWERIGKADANRDGKVTQEELKQAREAFHKKGPRHQS